MPSSEGDEIREIREAVAKVTAAMLKAADGEKLRRLKEVLRQVPERIRPEVEILVLSGAEAAQRDSMEKDSKSRTTNTRLAFGFGVGFLLFLIVAAYRPPDTDFGRQMLRAILPLPLAGVAAVVPGFLSIEGKTKAFLIRAGGAIAVFVIVYFFNPARL